MPNVKYMRTTQADGDIKDERESEKPRECSSPVIHGHEDDRLAQLD